MSSLKAFLLRLRIWWLESNISAAEDIQHRLRLDIPALHNERRDLLKELWALESDQPTA